MIYDTPFTPIAEALGGKTPVKEWMHTDGMGGDSDYESAISGLTPITEYEPQTLEDQCLLMYSSGTTGTPKGVIITHGMMYFSAAGGSGPGGNHRGAVSLANMPLFHIGGLNVSGTPAMWIGGTAVIMRMFDPEATLDAINSPELGITSLFMVPAAYNALRAHPKSEGTDFSRITTALCGAETVPDALVHYWIERGLYIQEGYGMTETAAAGCMLAKEDIPAKIGSAGKALMHSEIKIVDDAGNECAPNVPGEILFKGACITPGYWRRPEANAESFIDGWFRSGDIGRKDEDGFIYIEDRIKDMYISGGENVYPAEIENLLYQMDAIAEVAVIGVPDARFGETGCVVAVTKPDATLTLDDITAHVCDKLAKFKCPNHLHLMDALPRNATGKVLKFELRKSVPAALGLTTES
jgi:fatty-acyl-CoA synthase